jgi:hypothetical protein
VRLVLDITLARSWTGLENYTTAAIHLTSFPTP